MVLDTWLAKNAGFKSAFRLERFKVTWSFPPSFDPPNSFKVKQAVLCEGNVDVFGRLGLLSRVDSLQVPNAFGN